MGLTEWFVRLFDPRSYAAWRQLQALESAIKRNAPAEIRATYAALREHAARAPESHALRDMQLMGVGSILRHWLDARPWREELRLAGDDAAFADELWRDVSAIAEIPDIAADTHHLVVRVVHLFLQASIATDRQRAAAALRTLERLGAHCHDCAKTYYDDERVFGRRVKDGA